ncbi:MAG: trpF [Clostridiales bacterium]|jgi:phosphoribosylanthranilate isomerase|nr:trpF [Clostridiales bacterium]
MTKIKICGLTRENDIEAVNKIIPDYIGFVFAKSKRQVTPDRAKILRERLIPNIQVIGVFVNEEIERIVKLCEAKTIDIIQLHGEEDNQYIERLRSYVPNPIIKAIRVKCSEDIINAYKFSSDYLLLDAFDKEQYGGSGKSFDWSLIENIKKPFFLAGGINIENIVAAKESCNPFGIDVSSGVETDGYKDSQKITDIITKLRRE